MCLHIIPVFVCRRWHYIWKCVAVFQTPDKKQWIEVMHVVIFVPPLPCMLLCLFDLVQKHECEDMLWEDVPLLAEE